MKYLVPVLFLLGCQPHNHTVVPAAQAESVQVSMNCVSAAEGGLYRCENDEVVCYKYVGHRKGGLQCQFKESK